MLQLFESFKVNALNRLIVLQRYYLVTQTYTRGVNPFEPEGKTPLLLTDYGDRGRAVGHLNVLKGDRYAAVIDVQKPEHKAKLLEMLSPQSGYALFWAVVRSREKLEEEINGQYKDHIRRYVAKKTNWQIERNSGVYPKVELIFGELSVTLKHKGQTRSVPFAELEAS